MMRLCACALIALLATGGCSCSKSHIPDGGEFDASLDAPVSDSQSDRDTFAEDTSEAGSDARVDGDSPDDRCVTTSSLAWEFGPELVGPRDTRVVVTFEDGDIAVVGTGITGSSETEIFDVETSEFRLLAMAPLLNHTGTLLPSGRILAVGGAGRGRSNLPSDRSISYDHAFLIDPTSDTLTPAAPMDDGRAFHTATLLDDGRVFVAGGWSAVFEGGDIAGRILDETEAYSEDTDTWQLTTSMSNRRWAHTATKLRDGRILLVGGFGRERASGHEPTGTAEIYDPSTDVIRGTGGMFDQRAWHEAQLLPSGRVLVFGGETLGGEVLSSAEIYDPETEVWSAAASLPVPVEDMASLVLPSGRILTAGGFHPIEGSPMGSQDQVSLYDESLDCWQSLARCRSPAGTSDSPCCPMGASWPSPAGPTWDPPPPPRSPPSPWSRASVDAEAQAERREGASFGRPQPAARRERHARREVDLEEQAAAAERAPPSRHDVLRQVPA